MIEPNTQGIGRFLLIGGGILALIGLIFILSPKIPFLGRLPGDIVVKRENFSFYFPIMTSILLSLLLSFILWLVRRLGS